MLRPPTSICLRTSRRAPEARAPGVLGGAVVAATLSLAAACSAPSDGATGVPEFGAQNVPPPPAGQQGPGPSAAPNPSAEPVGAGADPGTSSAPGNEGTSGVIPLAGEGAQTGSNAGSGDSGGQQSEPSTPETPGAAGDDTPGAPDDGQNQNPEEQGPGDEPAVTPPAAPVVGCDGQFLCDDFEGVAAGSSPDTGLWNIVSNYNYQSSGSASVQVSSANAFGGGQALRVESDGNAGIFATVPAQRFHVRAMMQVDAAPLGPVLMGLGGPDHNNELRFRIQSNSWATINIIPSDDVLPQAAREGNCPTCPSLPVNQWFCVEFFADNATQNATLSIDGVVVATKESGQGAWPAFPAEPTVRIGTMSLQGGSTGVWVDDVVIGPEPIGCPD